MNVCPAIGAVAAKRRQSQKAGLLSLHSLVKQEMVEVHLTSGQLYFNKPSVMSDGCKLVQNQVRTRNRRRPIADVLTITGELIFLRPLAQPRIDRVEMNISRQVDQIRFVIDVLRLKASLKERSGSSGATVNRLGVRSSETLHGVRKSIAFDAQEKMIVIWHETIRQYRRMCRRDFFAKPSQKEVVLIAVEENRAAIRATIVDVVIRAWD